MDVKKFLPHLIAVAVLLAVAAIFYAPNAFSGKVLPQPDNDKARAMQTEIRHYLEVEGKVPLWTNSGFGGMPSYQILSPMKGNLTRPVYRAMFFFNDYTGVWAQTFAAMLCMYLLLVVLRIDWRVGIFGALAYGITSYNVDLIEAGHSTKMAALVFAPAIFAGAVLAAGRGRWLLGSGVMALFTAMQVLANHIQITYYTLLLVGIYFAAVLVEAIMQKKLGPWLKAAVACAVAVGLGFAANYSILCTTLEYSHETIRGRSELSGRNVTRGGRGDGLDTEYAFGWSYGKMESMTLIAPHAYGGGANERITDTKVFSTVTRGASPADRQQIAQQLAAFYYHGDQPFVGTAIYLGAIVCFLFFLGAFLVPGSTKWWLVAGAFFALTIAWGRNFDLNYFWFKYLPMFNKFRSVSMALGLTQLCVAALAALGLQAFFDAGISKDRKAKALYIALGVTTLLCLVAGFMTGGEGPNDAQIGQNNPQLLTLLNEDRAALAKSDALRSLGFIALAAALLWLALQGRLKAGLTVGIIAAAALFDNWAICRRTISADNFEEKRSALAPPRPEPVDEQIRQDNSLHYRVLDLSRGSITTNWMPSYFHKSLSGYHAAKLQRFQEVVDTFIGSNPGKSLHLIGLLNGKYIINTEGQVILNPSYHGNAWFVKHIKVVPNGEAEFRSLSNLNPRDTAIVQEAQAGQIKDWQPQFDSTANIRLTGYHPDKMEYTYSAKSDQLAIFSEIYYPADKGWKLYLDGQPAPDIFKADYLVRAAKVPAGQNRKLEMRFEPACYYTGENIARIASALALLLCLLGLFFRFRREGVEEAARLTDMERPETERAPKETKAPVPPKGGKKK